MRGVGPTLKTHYGYGHFTGISADEVGCVYGSRCSPKVMGRKKRSTRGYVLV